MKNNYNIKLDIYSKFEMQNIVDDFKYNDQSIFENIKNIFNSNMLNDIEKRKLILTKLRHPQSLTISEIKVISEMYDALTNKLT